MITALIAIAFFVSGAAYAAEGEQKEGPAPEFEYYVVPSLILPVVSEKGLTQQVSIVISLELPFGKKDEIAIYGPRLVDAYIRDMFGALGSGQVMIKGNVLDVESIKARLTAVTDKVLGEKKDTVRGLLLQAVQQHQI